MESKIVIRSKLLDKWQYETIIRGSAHSFKPLFAEYKKNGCVEIFYQTVEVGDLHRSVVGRDYHFKLASIGSIVQPGFVHVLTAADYYYDTNPTFIYMKSV